MLEQRLEFEMLECRNHIGVFGVACRDPVSWGFAWTIQLGMARDLGE